jgi:Uma2 family endonuclease
MAMPKVRQTLADYERLPEHVRADFIEGELVMDPAPTYRHEHLVMRLVGALAALLGSDWTCRVFVSRFEVKAGTGDEKEAAQPDVVVLPEGTMPPCEESMRPIPVFVAEILSPSTARYDRGAKLRFYARAGVREAWILDPASRTIEVHDLAAAGKRLCAAGEIAESRAVPGLRVDVAAFFAV